MCVVQRPGPRRTQPHVETKTGTISRYIFIQYCLLEKLMVGRKKRAPATSPSLPKSLIEISLCVYTYVCICVCMHVFCMCVHVYIIRMNVFFCFYVCVFAARAGPEASEKEKRETIARVEEKIEKSLSFRVGGVNKKWDRYSEEFYDFLERQQEVMRKRTIYANRYLGDYTPVEQSKSAIVAKKDTHGSHESDDDDDDT